ncbi:MAG: T9SS type A sorting domain-containing protein [Sphingobacteriales bacterium]|nr:MAG: T9SS type A sorting domain-containing protein [Sphingobacteriales bacterium]
MDAKSGDLAEQGDENNIPSTDTAVSGELIDMNGQTKTTVQINNNQATFSVAGLPMGVYILNINVNGQIEGHQIAVE